MSSEKTDSSVPQTTISQRRRWLYLLGGCASGAFFLYLAARNVDIEQAAVAIYGINCLWLVPITAIFLLNVLLRSVRWQLTYPDNDRPSFRYAVDGFLIGKVGNNFMPGKLGDLLRASIIGRVMPGVGFSGSLATIVVEKLFDVMAVLIMLGLAVMIAPLPDWLGRAGLILISIVPLLLVALLFFERLNHRIHTSSDGSGVIHRAVNMVTPILHKFSVGLYALRNAQHFMCLSVLTMLIWLFEVLLMYLCFKAFAISLGPTAALVTMVFLCIGGLLPAAPGLIGTYQFFIVAGLQLYAISETSAFALAIFLNLYVIIMTTLLGAVAMYRDGGLVNFRQIFGSRNTPP